MVIISSGADPAQDSNSFIKMFFSATSLRLRQVTVIYMYGENVLGEKSSLEVINSKIPVFIAQPKYLYEAV